MKMFAAPVTPLCSLRTFLLSGASFLLLLGFPFLARNHFTVSISGVLFLSIIPTDQEAYEVLQVIFHGVWNISILPFTRILRKCFLLAGNKAITIISIGFGESFCRGNAEKCLC